MERKEHPVPVIKKGGEVLEFLDSEGNPFKPSGSVKYQIIAEDGSVLSEGTLDQNSNTVPLSNISSKTFKVVVDSHFIVEIHGAETPDEESGGPVEQIDELVIPPSSSDPDDELALPEDFDADQPVEPDVGTDSETTEDEDSNESQDANESEDESDNADKDSEEKDYGDSKEEDSSDDTEDDESSEDEKSDDAQDEGTSNSTDDNVDENSDKSDSDNESEDDTDG